MLEDGALEGLEWVSDSLRPTLVRTGPRCCGGRADPPEGFAELQQEVVLLGPEAVSLWPSLDLLTCWGGVGCGCEALRLVCAGLRGFCLVVKTQPLLHYTS